MPIGGMINMLVTYMKFGYKEVILVELLQTHSEELRRKHLNYKPSF